MLKEDNTTKMYEVMQSEINLSTKNFLKEMQKHLNILPTSFNNVLDNIKPISRYLPYFRTSLIAQFLSYRNVLKECVKICETNEYPAKKIMAFLNSQLLEVFLILQLDFDDKHVISSENVWGCY